PHARRQNEIVVRDSHFPSVRGIGDDVTLRLVHCSYFAKDHLCIWLFPEHAADGSADLPGCKNGGRDLVEQRLKQVVVGAVNQNDFGLSATKSLRGRQTTKASANNNNAWKMFGHNSVLLSER